MLLQGDSGGPLLCMDSSRRWSVVGIVSWGQECGKAFAPGVFTKVPVFVDLIKEVTGMGFPSQDENGDKAKLIK